MAGILKTEEVYQMVLTPEAGECQFPLLRQNAEVLTAINAERYFTDKAIKHFAEVGIYNNVRISDATNKRKPKVYSKGNFLEEFEALTDVPYEYTEISFIRSGGGTIRNFINIGANRWLITGIEYNPPKPGDFNTDFTKPTTPILITAPKEKE